MTDPQELSGQAKLEMLKKLERRYHSGDLVIRQGESSNAFYILKSGALEVVIDGKPVRKLETPGETFGELAALKGLKRTADVKAVAATVCYEIPKDGLLKLMEISPHIALRIVNTLATSLVEITDKYKELVAKLDGAQAKPQEEGPSPEERRFLGGLLHMLEELKTKQKVTWVADLARYARNNPWKVSHGDPQAVPWDAIGDALRLAVLGGTI